MRYLLTVSVLISAVGLSGCGSKLVSGVAVDKAFRPFIPADAKVLAGINLEKLKTSVLYQKHENVFALPMIQGFSDRLGVDPRRDISQVLIAWDGKDAVFLVRGTFKRTDVEHRLTGLGFVANTYKDHQVSGDQKNSVTFLSDDLVVEAPGATVRRMIDSQGNHADAIPEELGARLKQLPSADQVWIVSRAGLPFADVRMRSDVASALSNIVNYISGANVGLKADDGTHLQMDLTCISEQGAKRVHDALRGAIGLGRLSTKDNERELLQVYDGINVDQDKALIHVHADYSGELTEKLFGEVGQMGRALQR